MKLFLFWLKFPPQNFIVHSTFYKIFKKYKWIYSASNNHLITERFIMCIFVNASYYSFYIQRQVDLPEAFEQKLQL